MPLFFMSRWLWYAVAIAAVFASGLWIGYDHERKNFLAFKAEVEAVAQAAETKAKETEARHEASKAEIEQDYKERLAAVQRRYADSLRKSSSSAVPRTPDSPRAVDEAAANSNPYFVEKCAETTLQLVELQKWIERTRQ